MKRKKSHRRKWSHLSYGTRLFVLKYWGFKCAYCRCDLSSLEVTADHFIPRHKGGNNGLGNIVPCCTDCNSAKSNRSPADFCSPDAMLAISRYFNLITRYPNTIEVLKEIM